MVPQAAVHPGEHPAVRRSWLVPVAVLAGYALVARVLYAWVLDSGLKAEDAHWIQGEYLGTPLRHTQHLLLHYVGLPLFNAAIERFYWLTIGLHVACAALVYGVTVELTAALSERRRADHLAAATAGALMLLYNNRNVDYVSALSYQLLALAILAATWAAARCVARPSAWWWLAAVLAYGLALGSNVLALWFPLVWLLWELAQRQNRPRWDVAARQLVMLALLVGFASLNWSFLQGYLAAGSGASLSALPAYLEATRVAFVGGLAGLPLRPSTPAWLVSAGVLVVLACALHEVWARKQGIALVAALFGVLWLVVCFPQLAAARDGFGSAWRFYPHAAGLCIAAAYLLLTGLRRVRQLLPGKALGSAVLALGVAAPLVGLVAINPRHRAGLAVVLGRVEAVPAQRDPLCQGATMVRVSADELRRRARSGASLRCLNLAGLQLTSLDLAGADLRGSDLTWARLDRARAARARLSRARLFGVQMKQADLRGADLSWARARGALLSGVNLQGANLAHADFSGARLARADLRGAQLQGARLIKAGLEGVSLQRAKLTDTDLHQARLEQATLDGAELNNANLQSARICARYKGRLGRYRGSPVWVPCP